ncbi:Elongation factor Tu [Bienertia sinuspersici]
MNHKGINDRKKLSYVAGVDSFLEFAFTGREVGAKLRCPCLNCNFQLFHDRDTMKCHLIAKGIVRDYNPWVHHGETLEHVSTSDQCQH